jgi:hypothetical protein
MNGGHVFGVERLKSPLDRAPAVHRALLGVSQREFHGGHALTGFSIDSDKRRAQLLISLPDESVAGSEQRHTVLFITQRLAVNDSYEWLGFF